MKHFFALLLCSASALQSQELTLQTAVELAVQRNPQVREAAELVKAAKARAQAAGTIPNPEAIARVERAPSNPDYLIGAGQTIPLAGRLGAARELENIRATSAELEAERVLLRIRRKVQGAFATALFADEAARIQSNTVHDAQALARILKARVKEGDALPEDLARAESQALRAKVELKRAEHLQEHARKALLAEIGDPKLSALKLKGEIDDLLGLDHLTLLVQEMKTAESLGEAAVQQQKAALALARKERIPDLKLELLYRREETSREDAFDIGISIPIPLFDRSRAKIQAASAELRAAQARLENTRLKAEVEQHELRAHLETALDIATLIRTQIQPRAVRTLDAATSRYKAGDTSLAEYLRRRGEYLEVQEAYLNNLRAIAEIWTLTAPH